MTSDEIQTLKDNLLQRLKDAPNAEAIHISAQLIALGHLELASRRRTLAPPGIPTTTV
jgi:hypothetical protein